MVSLFQFFWKFIKASAYLFAKGTRIIVCFFKVCITVG